MTNARIALMLRLLLHLTVPVSSGLGFILMDRVVVSHFRSTGSSSGGSSSSSSLLSPPFRLHKYKSSALVTRRLMPASGSSSILQLSLFPDAWISQLGFRWDSVPLSRYQQRSLQVESIKATPPSWTELDQEEARIRRERRELLREIDRHDIMLKRLRYDRIDYLVRRQNQRQEQQQRHEQQKQQQKQDGRQTFISSYALKRVSATVARLGVGAIVMTLASTIVSATWLSNWLSATFPAPSGGVMLTAKTTAVTNIVVSTSRSFNSLPVLVSCVCALKMLMGLVWRRFLGRHDLIQSYLRSGPTSPPS
jgi:hypothetical protein